MKDKKESTQEKTVDLEIYEELWPRFLKFKLNNRSIAFLANIAGELTRSQFIAIIEGLEGLPQHEVINNFQDNFNKQLNKLNAQTVEVSTVTSLVNPNMEEEPPIQELNDHINLSNQMGPLANIANQAMVEELSTTENNDICGFHFNYLHDTLDNQPIEESKINLQDNEQISIDELAPAEARDYRFILDKLLNNCKRQLNQPRPPSNLPALQNQNHREPVFPNNQTKEPTFVDSNFDTTIFGLSYNENIANRIGKLEIREAKEEDNDINEPSLYNF